MLKNILKLEGAQQLSKNEQQSINGGGHCKGRYTNAAGCCYILGVLECH